MSERQLPSAAEVGSALTEHLRRLGRLPADSTATVLSLRDLSPGLGQATVLAVQARSGDGEHAQWIAKLPAGGNQSLLELSDPELAEREVRFFDSPLSALLPAGLAVPAEAGTVLHQGRRWIFMRHAGAALDRRWTAADAGLVAARLAGLHVPVLADPALLTLPWLERDGYAGYAHHVPAGRRNLELLDQDDRTARLFTVQQAAGLRVCLDTLDTLERLAGRLTRTLLHGDLHIRNLGLTEDRTLLLIDWEHVGVGPVGVDLATFVSLYRLFGGEGELDERELLAGYGAALSELAHRDLTREAELGYAVSQLTWGLHLRLGPGLTAVRQGVFDGSAEALAAHLADIRSGGLRALRWARELGVATERIGTERGE